MQLVRRDDVQPAPPATARAAPDPYRVLFPLGIAAALAGLVPWILVAARVPLAWPGPAHAALMVQGFELAFICGFLLTAMPAFTHGPRCTPWELGAVTALVGAHVVLAVLGQPAAAWAYLSTLLTLGVVVGRRVRPGAAAPPEEFLLVGTGLALGLAGAVVQVLVSLGRLPEASARAGVRCV
jgi:uncharacterized protein involved in response to NO